MAGHQRTADTPAGGGRADTPAGGGQGGEGATLRMGTHAYAMGEGRIRRDPQRGGRERCINKATSLPRELHASAQNPKPKQPACIRIVTVQYIFLPIGIPSIGIGCAMYNIEHTRTATAAATSTRAHGDSFLYIPMSDLFFMQLNVNVDVDMCIIIAAARAQLHDIAIDYRNIVLCSCSCTPWASCALHNSRAARGTQHANLAACSSI
jgi:hypothetical protein